MRFFIFAALVAFAAAGTVVINGVCRDCSPPDAETVVVGGQVSKGRPGHGTVYINGQDANAPAQPALSRDPYVVPEGYSGRLPDGSFVHNSDCKGCDIRA